MRHSNLDLAKQTKRAATILYTLSSQSFLDNDPSRLRKGLFQGLQQFVGIGFKRDMKEKKVNLFHWDNGEVKELEKLTVASASRNTLP
jgi:hypothetical protein